jgi:hypothetical protein
MGSLKIGDTELGLNSIDRGGIGVGYAFYFLK